MKFSEFLYSKKGGSLYVVSLLIAAAGLNRAATLAESEAGFEWLRVVDYDCCIVRWLLLGLIGLAVAVFFVCSFYYGGRLCFAGNFSWRSRINRLISSTFSGSAYSLFSIIAFIALLAWLPDSVYIFVDTGRGLCGILIYVTAMLALLFLRPTSYNKERVDKAKRTVLLTGMSNVSCYNGKLNLLPVVRPLEEYPNISRIIVLLSDSVLAGVDKLRKANTPYEALLNDYVDKVKELGLSADSKLKAGEAVTLRVESILVELLEGLVNQRFNGRKVTVEFTPPVDYNSFKACNDMCYQTLKDDIKDCELAVNITPGTSIVASVLTLNAIKGCREMVYINQTTDKLITDETPDVTINHLEDWQKDLDDHSD